MTNPQQPTQPSSIALTLDGVVPDIPPRSPGAMRWMPPEQAATVRDTRRKHTTGKQATR